jgi:hypothetical protein
MAAYTMESKWFIACMSKVLDTLGMGERSNERADVSAEAIDSSLRSLEQECFQRVEDHSIGLRSGEYAGR